MSHPPCNHLDPASVFKRLAEIEHASRERNDLIDEIIDAQTLADREFAHLSPLAVAYLEASGDPAVTISAYTSSPYSRMVPYIILNDGWGLIVRPAKSVGDIEALEPSKIEALTSRPCEGNHCERPDGTTPIIVPCPCHEKD